MVRQHERIKEEQAKERAAANRDTVTEPREIRVGWDSATQVKRLIIRDQEPDKWEKWGPVWNADKTPSAMCPEEQEWIQRQGAFTLLKTLEDA
jgi:hypothetical protein